MQQYVYLYQYIIYIYMCDIIYIDLQIVRFSVFLLPRLDNWGWKVYAASQVEDASCAYQWLVNYAVVDRAGESSPCVEHIYIICHYQLLIIHFWGTPILHPSPLRQRIWMTLSHPQCDKTYQDVLSRSFWFPWSAVTAIGPNKVVLPPVMFVGLSSH